MVTYHRNLLPGNFLKIAVNTFGSVFFNIKKVNDAQSRHGQILPPPPSRLNRVNLAFSNKSVLTLHINACLCRSISTSVVGMASVLSSLSFGNVGNVQPISNSSFTNTELCPGNCQRGNPRSITVHCHTVIFSSNCTAYLFGRWWTYKSSV